MLKKCKVKVFGNEKPGLDFMRNTKPVYLWYDYVNIGDTLEATDLILSSVRHWEIMYGTRVPLTLVL